MYYADYNLASDETVFSLARSTDVMNWVKYAEPVFEKKCRFMR